MFALIFVSFRSISSFDLCLLCRAEGTNILLDPMQACKKTHKIPKKILDICRQDSRNKTSLLKKITKGISLGFRECENQFRHRKWNCTSQRRSMKKILLRGEFPPSSFLRSLFFNFQQSNKKLKENEIVIDDVSFIFSSLPPFFIFIILHRNRYARDGIRECNYSCWYFIYDC